MRATVTRPTDVLSTEHRVIEQVLGCLGRMAEQADAAQSFVAEDAKLAVDFFRTFADRCHHGKEEHRLFPALYKRGFPREFGPLAVMIEEHETGRSSVRALESALDAVARGLDYGRGEFARRAREYGVLLSDHIRKEDYILFPMAEGVLSEVEKAALIEEFERFEREDIGADVHGRLEGVAADLGRRYGVDRRCGVSHAFGLAGGCCGGGHGAAGRPTT